MMKYIILLWIVVLIVFTIFCLYRLNDKTQSKFINTDINNYVNPDKQLNINPNTNPNLITFLDDFEKNDNITDISGCENVYDDNIAVRRLGYNNCSNAYNDYLMKNLDVNKKYGNSKTLSEICPISSKSEKYLKCVKTLSDKYNNYQNIIGNVNQDLSNILNQRIQNRNNILADIELDINPYIYNKDIQDFVKYNTLGENINPSTDDTVKYVNNYYENRYGISKSIFDNVVNKTINETFTFTTPITNNTITNNTITNNTITNTSIPTNTDNSLYNVDSYIQQYFFGNYVPISGQYIVFNNLLLSLDYDYNILNGNNSPSKSIIETKNKLDNNEKKIGNIILTLLDKTTNAIIIFKIIDIDYYKAYKNVIKIEITEKTVKSVLPNDTRTIEQLLMVLGLLMPTRLFIKIEEFTSLEGIKRYTYKLLNFNMDTLMILNKI